MLYEKLIEYSSSGVYPMHMPGHKRAVDKTAARLPYDIDITEINGFDNLQSPSGLLLETAELAASIYGSDKAFLLVGGSSVGILAAIGAHVPRGGKILISRNSHISVHNAIALFGLHPVYIDPDVDEATGIPINIPPDSIRIAIAKEPDIKAVVITSPTYEGFISDIKTIADIAHTNHIPLIVDSAHGAHLGFSPDFPPDAVSSGADVVVMSLHKTLPALTQCALLHIRGAQANTREITRLLSVFQTTSPSYVLMASIDRCLHLIASGKDTVFREYSNKLNCFSSAVSHLKHINVIGYSADSLPPNTFSFDRSKLIITFNPAAKQISHSPQQELQGISGAALGDGATGCREINSPAANTAAYQPKNTRAAQQSFGDLNTKRLNPKQLSGIALADILRNKYKIETEAAALGYVLAMTSICDSEYGLKLLADALCEIDDIISTTQLLQAPPSSCAEQGETERQITDVNLPYASLVTKSNTNSNLHPHIDGIRVSQHPHKVVSSVASSLAAPPMIALPGIALTVPGHEVTLESALGLMSLEYVWAYPPGIPLIVPGEMITAELISHLDSLHRYGVELKSTYNALPLIMAAEN